MKTNTMLIVSMGTIGGLSILYCLLLPTDAGSWDRAVKAGTVSAFETYLQRYPDGERSTEAAELKMWATAGVDPSIEHFAEYLDQYPAGRFHEEAEEAWHKLADDGSWRSAVAADTPVSYLEYINSFPEGEHGLEAGERAEAARVKAFAEMIGTWTGSWTFRHQPKNITLPGGTTLLVGDREPADVTETFQISIGEDGSGRVERGRAGGVFSGSITSTARIIKNADGSILLSAGYIGEEGLMIRVLLDDGELILEDEWGSLLSKLTKQVD